jgi:haloalkane dehalogenase
LRSVAVMHHREAGRPGDPAVLLLHGFPESSHMWRDVLGPLADAGFHALAPDLAGFGDTPAAADGTWEGHVARVGEFVRERGLAPVALVMHDWGGLIGLRWACEAGPEPLSALVISSSGFFPDGRWHGMAQTLRTPGEGEQLVEHFTGGMLEQALASVSRGIGPEDAREYAKAFATPEGRAAALELYRSGDMAKLARYDGRLAELGVPTLLLWGADDPFAPVAGAHRFEREIPGAELVVLEGTGHFVVEDDPAGYAAALTGFLGRAI